MGVNVFYMLLVLYAFFIRYIHVCLSIEQSRQSTETIHNASQWRKNMKAIKNMLIVVSIFNVCLVSPMLLCLVMSWNPDHYETRLADLYAVFSLLFGFNSGMNPIVYAVRFRPFQVAFKLLFGCIKVEERVEAISLATS